MIINFSHNNNNNNLISELTCLNAGLELIDRLISIDLVLAAMQRETGVA